MVWGNQARGSGGFTNQNQSATVSTPSLLQENGSYLLQEDSGHILIDVIGFTNAIRRGIANWVNQLES